ncbi:MAG: DNA repair exonuclease [Thermoplasmata archaeon]|jgi:DNA repair exonuclease SbcCD nuclease subunit
MVSERFVFAHLADAHVGAWPRNVQLRGLLRESVLRSIEHVRAQHAEFLLISGDLFHTPVPDPAEVAPVAAALRQLSKEGTRIYAIYGSHDYVAHKTSWLDVLAEAGVFAKVAPEAVRAEGTRWTLPFLVDGPTGARIAGISGRSHGLDREYFRGVDSERFRAEPGFKIFQFHAAIEECLPVRLREHILGIQRADLPAGCGYYAGGHIHGMYQDEGPGGGLLVNPGAIFGTTVTDLVYRQEHPKSQGLAIVTVDRGRPSVRFFDPFPYTEIKVIDVDVTGRSAGEILTDLEGVARPLAGSGTNVIAHYTGTPTAAGLGALGVSEAQRRFDELGLQLHPDIRDVAGVSPEASPALPESEIEAAGFAALSEETGPTAPWAAGLDGARRSRELLQELALPRGEGESRTDYVEARVEGGARLLGIRRVGPR